VFGGTGAAAVTGSFALLLRFKRDASRRHDDDNARREAGHGENVKLMNDISERVSEIRGDVKEVHRRQNDHLEWHAEQSQRRPSL
jgi:hypothetical protein